LTHPLCGWCASDADFVGCGVASALQPTCQVGRLINSTHPTCPSITSVTPPSDSIVGGRVITVTSFLVPENVSRVECQFGLPLGMSVLCRRFFPLLSSTPYASYRRAPADTSVGGVVQCQTPLGFGDEGTTQLSLFVDGSVLYTPPVDFTFYSSYRSSSVLIPT